MALTNGDRGSAVTDLQRALDDAGFDPGKIDGIYGPKTAAAVRAWETDAGIEPTGVASSTVLQGLGLEDIDTGDGGEGPPNTQVGEDLDYTVPHDGTVYTVAGVGTVIVYETVALGVEEPLYVMYVVPEDYRDINYLEATNLTGLAQGGTLSEEEFDLSYPRILAGGMSVELNTISQDTYGRYWEETLLEYSGYNRVALEDADVRNVLYQALLDGASVEEMQAKLSQTDWWQASNDQSRTWDLATDSRREEIKSTVAGQLSEAWRSSWGIVPDLADVTMQQFIIDVSSGVKTYGVAVNEIRKLAQARPETPEAKRERELNRRDVDIENTRQEALKEGRNYGIQLTDAQLAQWSQGIVDLDTELTFNDFTEWLQQSAENTFGSREAGTSTRGRDMSVRDWAAPHTESYASLMEVSDDVDLLFNPTVRNALMDQSSVADFRKAVRESDEWKSTDNARAGVMGTVGELSRLMGY